MPIRVARACVVHECAVSLGVKSCLGAPSFRSGDVLAQVTRDASATSVSFALVDEIGPVPLVHDQRLYPNRHLGVTNAITLLAVSTKGDSGPASKNNHGAAHVESLAHARSHIEGRTANGLAQMGQRIPGIEIRSRGATNENVAATIRAMAEPADLIVLDGHGSGRRPVFCNGSKKDSASVWFAPESLGAPRVIMSMNPSLFPRPQNSTSQGGSTSLDGVPEANLFVGMTPFALLRRQGVVETGRFKALELVDRVVKMRGVEQSDLVESSEVIDS